MARSRNIKPGFFKNEHLGDLDPLARLLYAGLWTLADRQGILEDRPKRIKAEVLPYDSCNIEKLLEELASARFIVRYCSDGNDLIYIPTFTEHQNPHKNEPKCGHTPPTQLQLASILTPNREITGAVPEHSGANPADSLLLNPDSLNPITDSLNPITPNGDDRPQDEFKGFVDEWNDLPGVAQCIAHNDARRKAFKSRCKESINGVPWLQVFREHGKSKFPLKCASGPDAWRPDIEWMLRPGSLISLLEGKYDWRKDNGNHKTAAVGPGQVFRDGDDAGPDIGTMY